MTNVRQLERRIQTLERQVTGHHQHGTIASRLAKLEDTVTGDPMQKSSIAQRLDEIEASYRGEEPTPREVAEAERPPEDRIETIEQRLSEVTDAIDSEQRETDELLAMLDRVEARLLALERERRGEE